MRSLCKGKEEGGIGGSRSAQWKVMGDSSPLLTCTGIVVLEVEGMDQSLS